MKVTPMQTFWPCRHLNKIKNVIIPLWPSYYMSQNPQSTISQTELKHYNELINSKTEALRWVQMTTATRIKFIVKTFAK